MTYNKSPYLKSVALLTSGSMLGQIIGFVGSMFMTRLYSVQEIGIMSTVVAITGIFAPVINGRFDFAIVKEQIEDHVLALVKLSITFGVVASFIVSILSYFYFIDIEEITYPSLAVIFVFLILVIQAFSNVFRSYNNHVGDYKTMTGVIVMRRLSEELSMLLMGLASFGSIGLLVSRVIGQYFGMNQEIKNIKKHFNEILHTRREKIYDVYDKHKRQLYYSTPAALMNAASYSLINLIIANFFGLEVLGIYTISFAVLGLPLSVISGNVSKVYFGEASNEMSNTGNFKRSTRKTFKFLCICAIALFFVMYYLFPIFVPIIYGQSYSESGDMIRILSPMFAIRFVSSALNPGLVVANKQNIELAVQVFFIVAIGIAAVASQLMNIDMNKFLMFVSISYSQIYLANLLFIIKNSQNSRII